MPFDGTTYQHDEVLDLLRRARERIAIGWCQGTHKSGDRYCIAGALHQESAAISTDRFRWDLWETARNEIRSFIPNGSENWAVQAYNDAPDRTQAEIVALFDRAIARRMEELGIEQAEAAK